MKLSERLIRSRQMKGLTQEELAAASGLSVRTIQRIESGETVPRSFTVRTLAEALGESYEHFTLTEESAPAIITHPQTDDGHLLQMINLACFSYIVVPFVHFLIPNYVLRKRGTVDEKTIRKGRELIKQQIIWTISTHLLMLLTLGYNLIQANVFGNGDHLVSYLWPFLLMYFANAILIAINGIRIRRLTN